MLSTTQEEITVKFSINDEAPPNWRDAPDKFISLRDHAADAFRKLLAAGDYGVHFKEFRRDALARFDQNRIPYEVFGSIKRGSTRREWCRLRLPSWFDVSIIEGAV